MTDRDHTPPMRRMQLTGAILTDSHFLIPLIVFFAGLALLVAIR